MVLYTVGSAIRGEKVTVVPVFGNMVVMTMAELRQVSNSCKIKIKNL